MSQIMACGCAAQGTKTVGDQDVACCVVHNCDIAADVQPDLTDRKAVCTYSGHRPIDSRFNLAYFVYRPDQETDQYYCGCYGWD
jgi:hypothetical protein